MKSIFIIFALAISSTCAQIHFPSETSEAYNMSINQQSQINDETIDSTIAKGVLKLTLSIGKFMTNQQQLLDNMVYAPINIAAALALVLLGSNGKTFEELSRVLGLATGIDIQSNSQSVHEEFGRLLKRLEQTSSFTIGEEIKMAAAIFVEDDFPIRSIYKQMSESIYNSEILNLDFKTNPVNAKNVINAWVNDRTKSKIKTIINENPPTSTKIIITSALYFKAAWEKPFFVGMTKRRPFYTNGRKSKDLKMVDLMVNGGLFPYYRDNLLDCEIMGFPYKDNKTTMYVVMPNYSNIEKLRELQNKLTPPELERLVENTRYTQSIIAFPKMKLESSLDLSNALMNLGVKSLFDPFSANLALISPGTQLPNSNKGGFVSSNAFNPISASQLHDDDGEQVLIFSRFGVPVNCTKIFDQASNITKCEEVDDQSQKQVIYKKFGDKVGRRITRDTRRFHNRKTRQHFEQNLDNVRQTLGGNENPGLYADQVFHKVYMDITETGTEAAAATSVSLTRGGDITTFRVDVPFLFFIRNHETKLVLFWGAVNTPTPSYS